MSLHFIKVDDDNILKRHFQLSEENLYVYFMQNGEGLLIV